MKTILSLLFFFITSLLYSQTTEGANSPCPDPKKMRGFCMFIESKEKVADPHGRYEWKYQQKLLAAACVNVAIDSEEEIGKKVSAMMKEFEGQLICNNTKLDVANGNVIKFAVNLKFDEFIIDMCKWKEEDR